ncbi:hypothetical protein L249_5803 [Ophiocordyceps polyrhachis-furcata BCC 54312]|uniref:Uncharacterized protein n=1 Tax=Ophiocordyceps polyrhachis-furcata BCC 54312 TaxID=1330021 RepID=A0A367L0A3_9HYPO|nr:hypothetical protein L249_5803 [Ophiocordyceps polyrhachis-furcata BCC 54312]
MGLDSLELQRHRRGALTNYRRRHPFSSRRIEDPASKMPQPTQQPGSQQQQHNSSAAALLHVAESSSSAVTACAMMILNLLRLSPCLNLKEQQTRVALKSSVYADDGWLSFKVFLGGFRNQAGSYQIVRPEHATGDEQARGTRLGPRGNGLVGSPGAHAREATRYGSGVLQVRLLGDRIMRPHPQCLLRTWTFGRRRYALRHLTDWEVHFGRRPRIVHLECRVLTLSACDFNMPRLRNERLSWLRLPRPVLAVATEGLLVVAIEGLGSA